jgi:hypothetical protein
MISFTARKERVMPKNIVVVLCFITLLAVALDVFILHPRAVRAAGSGMVKIQSAGAGSSTRISGDVVGFSCTSEGCLIATQEKR